MRHLMAMCLGLGLSAGAALADDQVTSFTLDNGMDVVVIEDHRAPVAVHMVWYRAGSADEPAGTSGVAHYLEHLMFKGTETLAPGEFSSIVAKQGGTDNAFTSYDYTAYFQRVAKDRLDLMMQMEADRMTNLVLTEEQTLTERDVILEERNQRTESDPASLMREQMRAALYLNHPYAVPIIGWQREMEELDRADALAFYEQFYAPNNAILVVAGDVTPEEVRVLAEKHYGPIPANPDLQERARPQEPRHMAERRVIFEDPRVAQPYVIRSYLAPERDAGDQKTAAALTILSDLLGGGTTSVMAQALQFETQKAVYSGAWYGGKSLDDTTFSVMVVPAEGVSLDEAEQAMDEVIADFMATGPDPEHLARIQMQIKADEIYARDDVEARARLYGGALTQGLTIEDVQTWPEVLASVSAEDVMAAARLVFDRKKAVTGYLTAPEEEVIQ